MIGFSLLCSILFSRAVPLPPPLFFKVFSDIFEEYRASWLMECSTFLDLSECFFMIRFKVNSIAWMMRISLLDDIRRHGDVSSSHCW